MGQCYGAVIVPSHFIFHPVHLMNVELALSSADPQTKPTDLGCESAYRLLLCTSAIAVYYALGLYIM